MLLVCKAKFLYNVRLNEHRCSSKHHYQRVTETSLSTGYSWEGIRQVRATLIGARHVPERLCGGYVYLGRYIKCSTFYLFTNSMKIKPRQHELEALITEPLLTCLQVHFISFRSQLKTDTFARHLQPVPCPRL